MLDEVLGKTFKMQSFPLALHVWASYQYCTQWKENDAICDLSRICLLLCKSKVNTLTLNDDFL